MKARSSVLKVYPVCPDCVRRLFFRPYTLTFAMKELQHARAVERLYAWALFGV